MSTPLTGVVVLGCGLMGSALARTLATAGVPVSAWNRSPAKATALASVEGITPVESLAEAVRRAPILLSCINSYEDLLVQLNGANVPAGAVLVNVTSGTPDEAEAAHAWAEERGIRYLDGAIFAVPSDIGTSAGSIVFSGSEDTWRSVAPHLALFGAGVAVRYVGSSVTAANALEMAVNGSFGIAALVALMESMTFAHDGGVDHRELRLAISSALELLGFFADEALQNFSSGDDSAGDAGLDVIAHAARASLTTMRRSGYRVRLLEAAVAVLDDAEAAGLSTDAASALRHIGRA